jgi:hypothetical protein
MQKHIYCPDCRLSQREPSKLLQAAFRLAQVGNAALQRASGQATAYIAATAAEFGPDAWCWLPWLQHPQPDHNSSSDLSHVSVHHTVP